MRKFFALVVLALVCAHTGFAQESHEYAPIKEQTINYRDWTFKRMSDGTPVNLRDWAKGKKLALVVYFAPWCHNWHQEAPVLARLYDKYHAQGFDVIAVSEYGTAADQQAFFGAQAVPYTVVVESAERTARDKTTHYGYRQLTGDRRNWGSPYNIFLVPAQLNPTGDVLTGPAWVVGGELIEPEADQFIRAHLGLDAPPAHAAVPQ